MESSVTAERGAYSVENMYGLIRFEAEALGLSSQQRINGLIIFHPKNFAEVVGIQSLSESSLLLYTDIETDGGDSPYTVDLWPLEALTQVSHFKTHICPESRYVKNTNSLEKLSLPPSPPSQFDDLFVSSTFLVDHKLKFYSWLIVDCIAFQESLCCLRIGSEKLLWFL